MCQQYRKVSLYCSRSWVNSPERFFCTAQGHVNACLVAGVNLCLIPENWSNSTVQKNLSALFLTDTDF